jgi:hypothetical protein
VNKDIYWGLFSGGLKAKKNIMCLLEETQHPLIPLDWNCILNVSTATTGLRPDYVIL